MFFGSNLQFLRRRSGITQEQLAQQMGVSRQTISKWESGQTPELTKLMELADLFHCNLDDLLRQDLSVQDSPVRILRVKGFSMARYVMISPHAETDVHRYLDNWAADNGLENLPYLSWGFPYVSLEQKKRFDLQGFAGAYILPTDFHPRRDGPEIAAQEDHCYAVLSLPGSLDRDPQYISRAIQSILEYLWKSGIPKSAEEDFLPCFEWRHQKDGIPYVDIFLQCGEAETTDFFCFE